MGETMSGAQAVKRISDTFVIRSCFSI
jgi:hypothetical protein